MIIYNMKGTAVLYENDALIHPFIYNVFTQPPQTLTKRTPLDFTYRQAIKNPQPTSKAVPAKSWAPTYDPPSLVIKAPANGGPVKTAKATMENIIPDHIN